MGASLAHTDAMRAIALAILASFGVGALGQPTAAPPRRSLVEQLFREPPKPTNGFADYLRAADAVATNAVLGKLFSGEGDLTPFERNRRVSQEGKVALDLMRTGNRKPIEDPRTTLELDTLFPELAGFKNLVKVAQADMSYRYALGDSRGATDTFVDTSKFVSRSMTTPTLISVLVMIACDSILLAPLEQNLHRVALADLERLERTAGERVASVEFLQRAMAQEGRFLETLTPDDVSLFLDVDDDDEDAETVRALMKAWDAMTPDQRARLLVELRDRVRASSARVIAALAEPESAWKLAFPTAHSPKPTIVDYIAEQLPHSWPGTLSSFAKNRTQWRLLRLHARIERYRLVYGKLPSRLDEAAPADLTTDPWNDGPFDYKVLSLRDYELTSKGDATTGPIAILYRRQPRSDDAKAEPPPRRVLQNHPLRPSGTH